MNQMLINGAAGAKPVAKGKMSKRERRAEFAAPYTSVHPYVRVTTDAEYAATGRCFVWR